MAVLENNKIYLITKKDCIACNIQLHLLKNAICEFNKNITDSNLLQLDVKDIETNNIPAFIKNSEIKFKEFPITIFTSKNIIINTIHGTTSIEKLSKLINTYCK